MVRYWEMVVMTLMLCGHIVVCSALARAQGIHRTVYQVTKTGPEDGLFARALAADFSGDYRTSLILYELAAQAGICYEGSRCSRHRQLTHQIVADQKMREDNPESAALHIQLAIQYSSKVLAFKIDLGRFPQPLVAKAEQEFRVAAMLDPTLNSPLLGRATLFAATGDTARAWRLERRLREAPPRAFNPQDTYEMGCLYALLQERELALAHLHESVRLGRCHGCRKWAMTGDAYHQYHSDLDFQLILKGFGVFAQVSQGAVVQP